MVIMVGGSIAHEHKCTTAATESLKMAAILQIIGRQRHAVLVYQVFLWYLLTSIKWLYCRLKFEAQRDHMFFLSLPLTKCWFLNGLWAHVWLTCWRQGWFHCFCFVIKLKTEGQTIYRKPHRKVTKLKSKFYLILG